MERDPKIQTFTEAVKLLNRIAVHRLIAESDYPELRDIADEAKEQVPAMVAAIGRLKSTRAHRRADD